MIHYYTYVKCTHKCVHIEYSIQMLAHHDVNNTVRWSQRASRTDYCMHADVSLAAVYIFFREYSYMLKELSIIHNNYIAVKKVRIVARCVNNNVTWYRSSRTDYCMHADVSPAAVYIFFANIPTCCLPTLNGLLGTAHSQELGVTDARTRAK